MKKYISRNNFEQRMGLYNAATFVVALISPFLLNSVIKGKLAEYLASFGVFLIVWLAFLTISRIFKFRTRIILTKTDGQYGSNKVKEMLWAAIVGTVTKNWSKYGYTTFSGNGYKAILHKEVGVAEICVDTSTHVLIKVDPNFFPVIKAIMENPDISERLDSVLKEGTNLNVLYIERDRL